MTRATITQDFSGDLKGTGFVNHLMWYAPDGSARFVGQQDIQATLAGRTGSFVVHTEGTFEGGVAAGSWSVVPGSGTGGLQGLEGKGNWTTVDATTLSMTLEYELR